MKTNQTQCATKFGPVVTLDVFVSAHVRTAAIDIDGQEYASDIRSWTDARSLRQAVKEALAPKFGAASLGMAMVLVA